MYNKNQYRKFNDKKILHKVKKQWVTISLALLMMIGGGAVATHVSANADKTANPKPQVTSNAPQSNNASSITDQAKTLHNNMVRNAGLSQAKPAALGATKVANTPKIVRTAKWDNANVNYYNNDVMELTGNGSINASDVPNLPFNTNDLNYWQLKIDKSNANISLNNSKNGGQFSANFKPLWNKFKSMDLSGLNTSHVTNMSSMFEDDYALNSLDLSGFNTNNVTSMDYMFNGDDNLTDINMSHFQTAKASMKHMLDGTGNLSRFTIGTNTKLNAHNNLNFGTPYSDDPMTPWRYYPVSNNTLLYDDISLIVDKDDNNVTELFKNNTLPMGTYYIANPINVYLYTQNNDFIPSNKGIYIPINNYMYTTNISIDPKFNKFVPKLVQKVLPAINSFDYDYTINNGKNYNIESDYSAYSPGIQVNITVNYAKYLHDANENVQSKNNKAHYYQNQINLEKPYLSDSDYNNAINDSNFAYLQNSASDTQHVLSEPVTPNTVTSASGAESMANSDFNELTSNYNSVTSEVASNKGKDAQEINTDKLEISNDVSFEPLDNLDFNANKLNASEKVAIANDKNTLNDLNTEAQKTSNVNPTYSNTNEFQQMRERANSTLQNMDNIYESVSKATSSTHPMPSSKTNSVTPSSRASSNSSKPSSVLPSSNASSKASSATSKSSSKASQSVKPNSKSTTNSSNSIKSDSVAPNSKVSSNTSSDNSNASGKASSNANNFNSANSKSNNQSSSASQNNNNSSSVSSSEQQSNNNTNNAPLIPSFNVPTAPSASAVTPTNSTTLTNNNINNNNNNTSVVPSVEPQTNTNDNGQVNNSIASTGNKHQNTRISRNHHAKRSTNVNFSKHSRSAVTIKGVHAYKRNRKGLYIPIKYIKPNTKLTVNKVVKFGKVTNLQLTNGWLVITDNHSVTLPNNHKSKRRYSHYLTNHDFKGLSKRNRAVITNRYIRAYKYVRANKRIRKSHYVFVKYIRPNTKLSVKQFTNFGKINGLKLVNGLVITSNKRFVKVNKVAKRTNKRNAKRTIKGIDATRYNLALRKSNYVLRHGRRHATRYTYRIAKKFSRANNSEKKAYHKFARKHTNRNRKSVNKAITNLNKLVNALLK